MKVHRLLAFVWLVILVAVFSANADDTADTTQVVPRTSGLLIVSFADTVADTCPAPKVDSITAFDWLQIYSNMTGKDISIRHHALGDLIIGISNVWNGDKGNWLYQINGEMAMKACNKQRVSTRDTVIFIYK